MNYKILIDPSHGGDDLGIVKNNIKGKDINLALANYLSKRLDSLKIPNQLIRENDETISFEERFNTINSLIKNDKEIIVLVIDVSNTDNQVIYSIKENGKLANLIAKEFSRIDDIQKLAIQKRLPSNPASDFHYLLRESRSYNPIVINYKITDGDRNTICDDLIKYKEAVIKGITNFLNIDYSPEIKPGQYKVEQGDTIFSIAKKFNMTVDELKEKNNLKNNTIKINQLIQIAELPTEEIIETRTLEIIEEKPLEERLHHVVLNDTLYTISEMYNTTPDKIKNANNLLTDEISIGQILLIPND